MSAAGLPSEKGSGTHPLSAPSGAPPDLVVTELDSRFVTAYRPDGSMWQPATRTDVTDVLRAHNCEATQ